jgi:hypothetical protein
MFVGLRHLTPIVGVITVQEVRDDGERVLVLVGETPHRVLGVDDTLTKEVLERFHLESFRADHVLRFGEPPFDRVRQGGNPPDFVLVENGSKTPLDCVAFADNDRRLGFHLMDELKAKAVAVAGTRSFDGVAGGVVSVWFGPTISDLPPKARDRNLIQPLLDEISACEPDRAALAAHADEVARAGFAETSPPVGTTGALPDGSAGFVVNFVGDATARFPNGMPFDLQLARQAEFTYSDAVAQLRRLVDRHDKDEIRHLLVTAGGPDRSGIRYPGEEALAAFVLEVSDLRITTRHLERVTLHLWSARQIADVPVERAE